ncbi:helix-turn-helix domain-containing protein [Leuconostoc gelidum]|uniref:helix-turn-helix domain-containing protein n=1 Tax=Leuconostoc gelidum TaxID=1244 RepID=UPI0002192483|nr:helix-turn-helix domain-containing protein [Leuconostoc gelidum]AFS40480.1 helix-turn-helix domain-containing protein [Leuconostoc gelidum JB7]MBZ5991504.1 helix-turn-helix domain-containing protein [Leuconostoc gelidum subsp. gelidum]USP18081.1 helix-turn-helix domain-containing protein [Leuconostoc gelidum subsp. aenigmaticum]GMA68156.1 Cro/Cl family transcriptional regulator [Leuconostoc gelidum subsp. gelidum]
MIGKLVGENLKKVRIEKNMTLDNVAEMTGVSKPTLHNIETGKTSPSIDNLWKISSGLGIPINYFFSKAGIDFELVTQSDLHMIDTENIGVTIQTTFNTSVNDNFETFKISLSSQAERYSEPHVNNTIEMLIVTRGALTIVVENVSHMIHVGELAKFNAQVGHQYINQESDDCEFYCIMLYENTL